MFLERLERALWEVRFATASGEDAADRVWAVRHPRSAAAWRREAGDVRLSGVHPQLWREAFESDVSGEAEDVEEADAGSPAGVARYARSRAPSSVSFAGGVAGPGGDGVLPVLCHPRQHPGPGFVPDAGGAVLAEGASSPQSKASSELGRLQSARESSHTAPASLACLSERSLLRQTPEVGAGCGSSARPDLCGGLGAIPVPTATGLYGTWCKGDER